MSKNIGTLITSPIRPNDSLDDIASAFANEIKGGHHVYATRAERDSIYESRRDWNMLCTVYNDGVFSKTYQLQYGHSSIDPTDNNNWVIFNALGAQSQILSEWEDYSETNTSELNLYINLSTTLDEIYNNKVKELYVSRHVYKNNDYIMEEKKFNILLYNDTIILEKEGEENLINNEIIKGDIIIKIKCKKHHFLQRINDYDLLLFLPITLYEIFYGFKKKINYFNNEEIILSSNNPFKDYKFDGDKIVIALNDKGLPIMPNFLNKLENVGAINRGKLIIFLILCYSY